MPWWVWLAIVALAIPLTLYAGGRILPLRLTGTWYFKKLLWKEGVDWRVLPDSCIRELVDGAVAYARVAIAVPQFGAQKTYFYVEFDRMLKLCAGAVAAAFRHKEPEWQWPAKVLKKYGVLD